MYQLRFDGYYFYKDDYLDDTFISIFRFMQNKKLLRVYYRYPIGEKSFFNQIVMPDLLKKLSLSKEESIINLIFQTGTFKFKESTRISGELFYNQKWWSKGTSAGYFTAVINNDNSLSVLFNRSDSPCQYHFVSHYW